MLSGLILWSVKWEGRRRKRGSRERENFMKKGPKEKT
jgi:hypothetical protein